MKKSALVALAAVFALSACGGSQLENDDPNDPDMDRGYDSHKLSDMVPSLWVSPNGCEFWIIDDGIEGYMSPRIDPATGLPRCR